MSCAPSFSLSTSRCMSLKKLLGPYISTIFLAFRDLVYSHHVDIHRSEYPPTDKARNRLFPGNVSQGSPFFRARNTTSEWVSFSSSFSMDVRRQRLDGTERVLISLG